MENKFKEGEVVLEKIRPNQKLIVKRYSTSMYYCAIEENPKRKPLVYSEWELKADPGNVFKS